MIATFVTIAILLVIIGGLLAAVDAALGVLSRADLLELAQRSRSSRSITAIAADVGAHVNVVNFMRVTAETTAAVLVTMSFATALDDWWWALLWSALVMIVTSFVLVGSSPRSVGRDNARSVVVLASGFVHLTRVVLGPIASGLVAIGDRVTPGRVKSTSFSSEEQLLSMVDEAAAHDVLEEEDRELIHSIFEFNDTVVREIMVPRTDMVTIESDAPISEAATLFFGRGISRIPVEGEDVDEIIGVLYLRDVARVSHEQPDDLDSIRVGSMARPAMFVPESQKADDLLRQMQVESNHLAMVVDEYGGIAGLVTMEDLIEELVGDISDEYDRAAPDVKDLGDGRHRVAARLSVSDLGEVFGLDLEDDDVDSVGGLLMKHLGRLPEPGDSTVVSGLILTADRSVGPQRRIVSVLVERAESLIEVQDAFDPDRKQQ